MRCPLAANRSGENSSDLINDSLASGGGGLRQADYAAYPGPRIAEIASCKAPHPWKKGVRDATRSDNGPVQVRRQASALAAPWMGEAQGKTAPEGLPTGPAHKLRAHTRVLFEFRQALSAFPFPPLVFSRAPLPDENAVAVRIRNRDFAALHIGGPVDSRYFDTIR